MKSSTWKEVVFHEELDETGNNGDVIRMAVIKNEGVECQVTWVRDGRSKILGPVKYCESSQVPS